MGNCCSPGCRLRCLLWCLFVLFLFPRGVLDEILNLIESVSEGFPSFFWTASNKITGVGGGLELVCGRPTLALSSA